MPFAHNPFCSSQKAKVFLFLKIVVKIKLPSMGFFDMFEIFHPYNFAVNNILVLETSSKEYATTLY